MKSSMFLTRFAALSMVALAASAAQAQDRVCWAQANIVVVNKPMVINDCMVYKSGSLGEFKKQCESISTWESESKGGKPPKLTYLNSCPAKPQGICRNAKSPDENAPALRIDVHYYARDAEALKQLARICPLVEGSWAAGTP